MIRIWSIWRTTRFFIKIGYTKTSNCISRESD